LLRYCSSIKSFCADNCFGSSRDKSCMAHIKQRLRPGCAEQKTLVRPSNKSPMENPGEKQPKREQQNPHDGLTDASWLFDELSALDGSNDDDVMNLGDIYDFSHAQDDGPAMLAAYLQTDTAHPSSRSSPANTISTSTPPESPQNERAVAERTLSRPAGADNIFDSLSSFLGPGDGQMNDSWASSAVDVLGDAFGCGTFPTAPMKPRADKLGRPMMVGMMKGVSVPISKHHTWARPPTGAPQRMGKPAGGTKHNAKGSGSGPTQRNKCVWKQQVTW